MNLSCASCKSTFDLISNKPRIFPGCGHTFCSHCFLKFIQNSERTQCPEDGTMCSKSNSEKGIEGFPVNNSLIKLIEQSNAKTKASSKFCIETERHEAIQLCSKHNKIADIVCLSDKCMICHKCALFGEHKLHEYKDLDDFKEILEKKIETLASKISNLNMSVSDLEKKDFIKSMKTKVESKRNDFLSMVTRKCVEIKEKLVSKEAEVQEKIHQIFNEFSEAYEYISSNSIFLAQRKTELNRKLSRVTEYLGAENLNVPFYLENFYSEISIFDQFQTYHKEVNEFESTSKNIIDKQLELIKLDCNIERVISEISTSLEIGKLESLQMQKTQKIEAFELKNSKEDSGCKENENNKNSSKKSESPVNIKKHKNGSISVRNKIQKLGKSSSKVEFRQKNVDNGISHSQSQKEIISDKSFKIEAEKERKDISSILSRTDLKSKVNLELTFNHSQSINHRKADEFCKQNDLAETVNLTNENGIGNDEYSQSDGSQQHSINEEEQLELTNKNGVEKRYFQNNKSSSGREEEMIINEEDFNEKHYFINSEDFLFDNDFQIPKSGTIKKNQASSFLKKNGTGSLLKNPNGLQKVNSSDSSPTFDKNQIQKLTQAVSYPPFGNNAYQFYCGQAKLCREQFEEKSIFNVSESNNQINTGMFPAQLNKCQMFERHVNQSVRNSEQKNMGTLSNGNPSYLLSSQTKTLSKGMLNSTLNLLTGSTPSTTFHKNKVEVRDQFKTGLKNRIDSDLELLAFQTGMCQTPLKTVSNQKKQTFKKNSTDENETEMNLSNKAINISRLPEILLAVARNQKIKVLNLSNNYVNERGVEMILEKLMNHSSLETINLNGNDIEEEVFEILCSRLKNNKRPRTISMKDNKRFKNFPLIKKWVAKIKKYHIKIDL